MIRMLITLCLFAFTISTFPEKAQVKVAKPIQTQIMKVAAVAPVEEVVVEEVKKVKEVAVEENKRPEIKGIPLSNELLDYIWDKSLEYRVSYELVLAIAKVESDFDFNEESHTHDFGMMQIHKPTDKWIAEQLGREKYNLKNPRTSIDFAIYYLSYLREQYTSHGLSEEDAFDMVVLSYNRGIAGANRWVQRHGIKNTYVSSVLKWKERYESGGSQ